MLTTSDSCARPRYIKDLCRAVDPEMQPFEAFEPSMRVKCSDFPAFLGQL